MVFDSVPEPVALLDTAGVITLVNQSWLDFSVENSPHPGQPTPGTGVGTNYLEACRASARLATDESVVEGSERACSGISAVLERRLPTYTQDYPCHSPTRQRWYSMRVSPVAAPGRGAIVMHVDVTEARAAEQGARATHEQLMAIASSVPGVVYQSHQSPQGDWRFIFITQGVVELFEISVEAALADHGALTHCIVPEDRDAYRETLRHAGMTLEPWLQELRIRTASGHSKWVRGHATPQRLADGAVVWSGIMVDISALKREAQALAEAKEQFSQFMDNLPAAAFIKDIDGTVVYVNRYMTEIIGARPWSGRVTEELFPAEVARHMIADDLRALESGRLVTEEQVPHANGLTKTYETHKFRIQRQGQPALLGAIALDVSERRLLDAGLRASEQKYRALVETTGTGYLIVDQDGIVVDANAEYVRLAGYHSLGDILGKSVIEWTAEHEKRRNAEAVAQCAREGQIRNLVMDYVDRNQRITTIEINATVVGTGAALRIISLCRDITERRQSEEQVRQLAFFDALTRLPNRRLLHDRLSQSLATSKRTGRSGALMLFDLDDFKRLNDHHGHATGDLLLVELASRVARCVRETDTVARFGGDEFVVILNELDIDPGVAASYLGMVAERIRLALSEPYLLKATQQGGQPAAIEGRCTVSIGIAMFIKDELSQDDILKRADLAMYLAKDAGGNAIRFYEPGA
jgi:diguanylate cyclase (GGDEF)-like protein/PAS domain S-box-containing protein